MWRLILMKMNLTPIQQTALKMSLNHNRKKDEKGVQYRDKNGKFSTNIKHYSQTVNKIFPLLDPDITNNKKRELKHTNWFKDPSPQMKSFQLALEDEDELDEWTAEKLVKTAPC